MGELLTSAVFSVPLAQPKERHRKGAGGRMYTPEKTAAAEEAIGLAFKSAARGHRPDDTARWKLRISVAGANRAADVDNLAKTVMDGLQGVLYVNDKQVDELHIRRLPGREKRTTVAVYRIEEGLAMPWFMTDDKFHSHKKTVRATAAGMAPAGLWVICGSWSADQLTDGFVPEYIAMRYDPHGWEENAAALVRAGLWVEDKQDGEPGWQFHQWDERQPTREKVEAKRDAARERMEKLRASRKAGSQDVRANNERTSREVRDGSQDVRSTPALPNPSLPTLKESEGDKRPPRKRGQRLPEPFDVTEDMREWARQETPDVSQSEHEKFCDYFRSAPGQKGVKVDWVATWRNWMRRAQESAPARPGNVVAIRGNQFDDRRALHERNMLMAAELDALDEAGGMR